MAREPELSIKVKVDPQIKPSKLKTDIEGQIKKSGEKPQIDIDPNVDGIKKKVEDKLKNIKATANITPVVDTEKLKTDIQQQINGIGDIPKITVGVNVDDFSDELSKRLKEELKTVNEKLSYYLKNLTTNTAGLNSVVEGLFPSRGISNAVQSELKSVQAELTAGLKGVKSKVKPFKETDLFQIGDTESTTTIRRVEKLVKNIREQFANLDNFYDADEEKFLDGFNSEFEKFQNNASETVEKLSALKKNLSKDKFSDLLDNDDFDAESTTKALTPLISFLKKLSTASIKTGEDYDNLYALFNNKNTNKLFDDSNDHLTRMKTRVGDITAETKTAIEVTGELAKTLNKAIKDDNSGYLSDAEIKTYGAAFDEVLSNIATKQEEINTKKQRTVELENDLLAKTRSNREALRQELEEYKKLLKSFGVKGDEDEGNPKGKSKPKSKEPDKTPTRKPVEEPKAENQDALNNGIAKIQAIVFDINQEELQKSIDTIFAKVSAPIGFKPANGAIANIKQQLQEAFSDVEINATNVNLQNPKTEAVKDQTSIPGKVTITDADVIVDVKNPVSIPGTVTVDPNSVQLGNSDDLQKNANALSSVKQSLNKISTSAENYGTKIAAIGPSVQYVAQEVDNLSKSLENQITDLDIIAKKTDAYSTTANSIALNTKDVPVAGNPVGIPGKVELKDEDINRPDPLKLNGSVKIKASDVKIDDVEISKKKFDINGNLILKNAEIVDAVKEAAGEAAKAKKKNKPTKNSGGGSKEKSLDFDRKAKEAHLGWLISNIGENRTYLQNAISNKDSKKRSWYAGKVADYEKDFEETTRELIENLTEEEQDWIKSLKGIKDLDLNDPKQIDELMADKTILWPWEKSDSYLNGTLKAANMAGFYNVSETDKAKKRNSYEKEYVELIKQKPALIKAAAEARKQYGEDSDAYKDAVRAKKENEEALRAINPDRQKSNVPRGIVDGGYSNSPAVQSTLTDIHKQVQKRRSELLLQKTKDSKDVNDKQTQQAKKILSDAFIEQVRAYADGLKESAKYNDDDVSESAKIARKQMQDAFDSANDKFLELLDVFSGDEIDQLTLKAKKELDSANRIVDRRIANLTDNNNKQNLSIEDRQKALDQIRAAIKKNSNNMDRARKNGSAGSDLYSQFNAKQTIYKALEGAVSSESGVKDWAKTYFPAKVDDINNVTDALREMRGELTEDQIKLAQVSTDKSIERSTNRAATAVANLKSKVYDYFETNKKIQNSELAQPFRDLMNALNSENAPERIGELQKQFAELRSRSKELGLETENLIDKFEKLFGTHLSTMITMAALHKMQDALRVVYQNVVEIDTAVTELRKVSEYTGKSLEEYMGRAAEQAQKLGVSISDYVNSTADWKRLGYSDEDAENLATYSTLLRNVGDGIDDVNTSSSYLISTLQGFGLLADQAEDVVNKIDAVANTQPVTANDLGEILIRSSAAMSAANNTLEETIALGTAANAVIQDADTVGKVYADAA